MQEKSTQLTGVLALLLFALLALCLLLGLLAGARVYQNLVEQGSRRYAARTAAMYIATRVRQSQTVAVEDFDGCVSLTAREEQDGEVYLTRVYCYEGWLWELYCPQSADLSPGDGEKVLESETLGLSLEEGFLTVELEGTRLTLWLGQGKEVAS